MKVARAAISKIRKEGKLADIPDIIEALRLQKKEPIHKEIHNLLCDIQLAEFPRHLIDAVKDPKNVTILAELLCICWESKQDFTGYLEVFVSIFLNADYVSSIEAFTMIEKIFMDYKMPLKKLQTTIDVIKTSYPDLSENKREIALVLIDSLESKKNQ